MRARIAPRYPHAVRRSALYVVPAAAIFGLGFGLATFIGGPAQSSGEVVNAAAPVAVSAAPAPAAKPCSEQTWPYIDQACLSGREQARNVRVVSSDPAVNARRAAVASENQAGTNIAAAPQQGAPADGVAVSAVAALRDVPMPRARPASGETEQAATEGRKRIRVAESRRDRSAAQEQRRTAREDRKMARVERRVVREAGREQIRRGVRVQEIELARAGFYDRYDGPALAYEARPARYTGGGFFALFGQ